MDVTDEVPEQYYEIPLGSVAVRRSGTDVTILANMLMVHRALRAAAELEREGISAEVIDVRCLVPLDTGTMAQSVTLTLGMYWEKRLSAAQRRFTRACETLARVRKLSRNTPALQFNIATSGGQQVNLSK